MMYTTNPRSKQIMLSLTPSIKLGPGIYNVDVTTYHDDNSDYKTSSFVATDAMLNNGNIFIPTDANSISVRVMKVNNTFSSQMCSYCCRLDHLILLNMVVKLLPLTP